MRFIYFRAHYQAAKSTTQPKVIAEYISGLATKKADKLILPILNNFPKKNVISMPILLTSGSFLNH